MAGAAQKTDPELWEKVKQAITNGDRGGNPGQWSARKAQLAVQKYKKQGGGYTGNKNAENHLRQWTDEDWGTRSGQPSGKTGERYLPKQARENLSDQEYARTSRKKREDTRRGKQYSAQPARIARKTAASRQSGPQLESLTRPELLMRAAEAGISGRSRMRKDDLVAALR